MYFDRREYVAESGVCISTAESTFLSQGCIFGNSQLHNRETEISQLNGQFFPVLTRKATAGTIEPPYCTHYSQSVTHKFSWSNTVLTRCVEPHMAGETLLVPGS